MPDFERVLDSLALHVCKDDVERAHVRGRRAGTDRARWQFVAIVLIVVAVVAIVCPPS